MSTVKPSLVGVGSESSGATPVRKSAIGPLAVDNAAELAPEPLLAMTPSLI